MKYKELEWTIMFDFPHDERDMHGYIPMKDGTFEPFLIKSNFLHNAMVWTDKKEAEAFAREHCGKYGWKLFPTLIASVIY